MSVAMKRATIGVIATGFVLASAITLLVLPSPENVDASSGYETPDQYGAVTPQVSGGDEEVGTPVAFSADGGVPSYLSDSLMQSASFGKWRTDPSEFIVTEKTYNAQTGQWDEDSQAFSASFDIDMVTAAGKDWFYLKGTADNGDVVFEQWKKKPIGLPPNVSYVMKKTELYRGNALGEIHTFGVDPERRFLLIIHGEPKMLSLLSLSPGHSVSTLFTSSLIPHLQSEVSIIAPADHVTAGRVWKILGDYSGNRTLLFDPENDGVFNSWQTYSKDDYWYEFPLEDWINDFLHY